MESPSAAWRAEDQLRELAGEKTRCLLAGLRPLARTPLFRTRFVDWCSAQALANIGRLPMATRKRLRLGEAPFGPERALLGPCQP